MGTAVQERENHYNASKQRGGGKKHWHEGKDSRPAVTTPERVKYKRKKIYTMVKTSSETVDDDGKKVSEEPLKEIAHIFGGS